MPWGRRPGDQVLLLLSRLSFTAHGNWKHFRSAWSSEGLWCVLFQKSLELSHDKHLNFEPLSVGEAWMVLSCVERTQLRCFDLAQATRIQPCYQASKESMTACSSAKRRKEKYQDHRHLLCWWISHYKVCFYYTSGNKTFPERGNGSFLKEWRSSYGKKFLKCESHLAGPFKMGVLRPELSLLASFYTFYGSPTWIIGLRLVI